MRTVGVGLVSVGWMGKLHSRAYLGIPVVYPDLGLRPKLVCAADTSPERQVYATDVLGYARATGDYREVVDDPAVDVVSICAPNALHREVALAAAAAGKPFWIEKPVGRDAEDAAAVSEAAAASGVVTAVGFNYRQAPAVAHIRRLVADGELGRVTSVRCVFLNGQAADPRVALSWRFQREHAGTGVLGDLLSHVADLVRFVLDDRITEVSAASAIVHRQRPVADAESHFAVVDGSAGDVELGEVDNDDYAALLARFAGGAIGTLEVSRVVVGPRCGLVLEVYGTRGSAGWDFERMNELRVTRLGTDGYTTVLGHAGLGEYARFQPGPGNAMGYDDLKVIEAAHFLDAARGDGMLEPAARATVADALAAARVVEAAVAASADERWVRVQGGRVRVERAGGARR
ncbi:Gfo/Idh/MocA family oxidoreductase [Pseudonocardia eucalypti]|uniref:Gfo/Idh/MocA family oxidoreductase n=1 Tax=Pseudonocardia eucalypti TaxID=648755 RepID=A0ABP9R3D8_9PSEU|nr:putative dehydrogenase [Pseudonocardia eucalypti]